MTHLEAAIALLAELAPASESIAPFFVYLGQLGENPTPDQIDACVRATVATFGWPQ